MHGRGDSLNKSKGPVYRPLRNNTSLLSKDYTMQELDKIASSITSGKKSAKKRGRSESIS